jgi:hypothetical protein
MYKRKKNKNKKRFIPKESETVESNKINNVFKDEKETAKNNKKDNNETIIIKNKDIFYENKNDEEILDKGKINNNFNLNKKYLEDEKGLINNINTSISI